LANKSSADVNHLIDNIMSDDEDEEAPKLKKNISSSIRDTDNKSIPSNK